MIAVSPPQTVLSRIRDGFELAESQPGRYYIQFPFTFRSGDWLPVALERTSDGWQLSDDGGLYAELSIRTRKDFYRGRLRSAIDEALAAYRVEIHHGSFVLRSPGDDDWPGAYADFVRALLTVERIVDDAERRRPSRWNAR